MDVIIVSYFLLLGLVTGFLAGLFGIGGGMVIVPALLFLLPKVGVLDSVVAQLALGTSFATIVVTGSSAAFTHFKAGNLDLKVTKIFAPALVLGAVIVTTFAVNLPKEIITKIFSVVLFVVSIKMMLPQKSTTFKPLRNKDLWLGGVAIGGFAGFGGIGGGAFIVPFLESRGIDLKKAIATSSCCAAILGLGASISFVINGFGRADLPNYSLGFIHLPALFLITIVSFLTAKVGVSCGRKLPVPILKKSFALLLVIISIYLFFRY